MHNICITVGGHKIHVKLCNTPTANAIYDNLPFNSSVQTWGNEIYFTTPINNISLENNAKDVVNLGELAFWVEGNCIAIGFGPTPISRADEIRLATKTNIWGHTTNDLKFLKDIQSGDPITVAAPEV